MIRKLVPALLLLVLAWLCILGCVGALTAALAVWLSSYWGLVGALLAVALGMALLAALALFVLSRYGGSRRKPAGDEHPLPHMAMEIWKGNRSAVLGASAVLALILISKPSLFGRMFSMFARTLTAVLALKKIM